MIIAVDFDGTLQIDREPNTALIGKLKRAQAHGDTVILWTCRDGNSLVEALRFLQRYGFRPNYVNSNCPEGIKRTGRDSRKVFADVYIDDKAAR